MLRNISILAVTAGFLTACGGSDGGNGVAQLGSFFARAFAQDRNAEPLPLTNVTLAMRPTSEPFNP